MANMALAFAALVILFKPISVSAQGCAVIQNVKTTFYGWPDNSPPGPQNARDCGRGKAPSGDPLAGGHSNSIAITSEPYLAHFDV